MESLYIIIIAYAVIITVVYLNKKFKQNKDIKQVIEDVKSDLQETASNIGELVVKSKEIIFDSQFTDAIKEFILIVEEKNTIAKDKGQTFLKGDEKKLEVLRRTTDWVANLTGSTDEALSFIENNKSKVDKVINDFVAFSNKMEGKKSLSEAEKIIEKKLKENN